MVQSKNRKTRGAKNPVAVYLVTLFVGFLCVFSIALLMGKEELMAPLLKPIAFACTVLAVIYTVFALRLGFVSSPGSLGKVHRTTRKEEPIFFFVVVIAYLLVSLPLALAMTYIVITDLLQLFM